MRFWFFGSRAKKLVLMLLSRLLSPTLHFGHSQLGQSVATGGCCLINCMMQKMLMPPIISPVIPHIVPINVGFFGDFDVFLKAEVSLVVLLVVLLSLFIV